MCYNTAWFVVGEVTVFLGAEAYFDDVGLIDLVAQDCGPAVEKHFSCRNKLISSATRRVLHLGEIFVDTHREPLLCDGFLAFKWFLVGIRHIGRGIIHTY